MLANSFRRRWESRKNTSIEGRRHWLCKCCVLTVADPGRGAADYFHCLNYSIVPVITITKKSKFLPGGGGRSPLRSHCGSATGCVTYRIVHHLKNVVPRSRSPLCRGCMTRNKFHPQNIGIISSTRCSNLQNSDKSKPKFVRPREDQDRSSHDQDHQTYCVTTALKRFYFAQH